MRPYAWIIDIDHMPDEDAAEGTYCNAKGVWGPRGADITFLKALKTDPAAGEQFQMFTDDHDLLYTGRLIGVDTTGFEPLDDFGTPNAGCTEIWYDGEQL